jgi:hypothetical protein
MRSVFAIAPLAIMLAWLNPHTGTRGTGLAGSPSTAWAMSDAPLPAPADAASLPMVAYGAQTETKRSSGTAGAANRPHNVPADLLVNAAVVR